MDQPEQEELKKYKETLENLNAKSQDMFEKQLSFISSGAIGVSLLLIEKFFSIKDQPMVKGTSCNMMFVVGMTLLVVSLLLNLLSHPFSAFMSEKTIKDIIKDRFSYIVATKRWNYVKWFNLGSVVSLIIGIILIIYFITLNTLTMSDHTTKTITSPPGHETGTKGYVPSSTPSIEQRPAPPPPPPPPPKKSN